MKPVIAMPQMNTSLIRFYMRTKYVQSLKRAGAKVRWIPWRANERDLKRLMECDGLLMPGGDDIDPKHYGREREPKCGKSNPVQDSGELTILETFLATGKPILCICRGEQLMNVFCGGTLHQDIAGAQKCRHSDFKSRADWIHQVQILPGTRLASILGSGQCRVNSMHHQAVDTLALGLTVSAVSEDGYVEALEKQDHPFFLGVQWHPEHMSRVDLRQRKLFDAFVEACGKK